MIYYIYKEQGYMNLFSLNEENIFENIFLVVIKMKNNTMKVVHVKFPPHLYTLDVVKEYIYIYIYIY